MGSASPSRKAGYTRRTLYKQSPGKSPLRDVLKARCKERMRADRDTVVNGNRRMEMEDLEEIEEEFLAESFGLPLQQVREGDFLESLASAIVCPVCQIGRIGEGAACQVFCHNPQCNLQLTVPGGLVELEQQLERVVESHGAGDCRYTVVFVPSSDCVLAVCQHCDFLHSVGGL